MLRSWWPAAPPAELDPSLCAVLGSTALGGVVWLAEAGLDLVVEPVETVETGLVGALGAEAVPGVVVAGAVV